MLNIDTDSIRGKLFLLVVDKLVIGAILAAAFFAYDSWKTEEVRAYNKTIREAQDEFKKAEFVKELLPHVLDRNNGLQSRIEFLSGLIQTDAIDPNSAVEIALDMLREGKFVRDDSDIADERLAKSFARMLGPIIPAVLPQILDAYRDFSNISDAPTGYASALIATFEYAWRNFSGEHLSLLNNKKFVAEYLGEIWRITPMAHIQQEEWDESSPLALRILRDIEILETAREENASVVHARAQISAMIGVVSDDAESIALSTAILYIIKGKVSDSQFVMDAFEIIFQPDKVGDVVDVMHLEKKRDPFYHQFYAAYDYILNSSSINPKVERLAIPIVQDFLALLKTGDVPWGNYPMERLAVCALVGAVPSIGPDGKRSDEAEDLLLALAEIPESILDDTNIDFLIGRSDSLEGEIEAFRYCGLDLDKYR